MILDENIVLKYVSDEDKSIYEKWKAMELLPENGNVLVNLFLAKTYENFSKFLIDIGEENLKWGSCDFATLFIPITRRLHTENLTDNHELIYNKFKEWYSVEGNKYNTDIEYVTNFVKYFREFAKDNFSDDVKKYSILTDETNGISKPEYKKEVLVKNLEFEKCSEHEKFLVIGELSDLLVCDKLNICLFPIYKLNNEMYCVSETNDDVSVIKSYLDDNKTVSIFSAKLNESGDKIIYRYNNND